ncbi:unnamed protein product [Dracunculus medinensis]|uniref:TPR_REGION domain-containing protein n=1 Tax=Dracunculus medinensis TaxID=318479 RepID=A0A0N4UKG2_DRAME|nr:unnamed protein product [Dracunculus medinensis]
MAADLLYQSNETEKAIIHFAQLLDRNPRKNYFYFKLNYFKFLCFIDQYHALAVYIELNWRNGNIEQAEKYLKNALSANPRSTVHAGFNYCKGLYEWYIGEPNTALQAFNRARRDLEWGERAIYNMIEICLNPDNEIIGDEMLNHSEQTDKSAFKLILKFQDIKKNIYVYIYMIKELRYKPDLDYKYRLMEGFIMLASNNRSTVQQALNNFIEMAGENRDVQNVGAILGCAKAYIILKQVPKAKAQLKRVVGYNWTLENADYLEKCWLLLANLYINQGKNEQTLSLLRTVLQYNASSIKALEYFGYLKEREQKWLEAAMNFEKAWSLSKRCNPSIGYKLVQEEVLTVLISGYKLAHNYLKCKKLFDAIDVCHRILAIHPNFPKIKRDIMDKARANIRT